MIVDAHIHSFKSCENVVLNDIGSMLVLMGRNGVGKTNVLRAIEWAAQMGSSLTTEVLPVYRDQLGHVSLGLFINGRRYEYTIKIDNRDSSFVDKNGNPSREIFEELTIISDGKQEVVFHRENNKVTYGVDRKTLDISSGAPGAITVATLLPTDPVTTVLMNVMPFLHRVLYVPLDTPAVEADSHFLIRGGDHTSWMSNQGRVDGDGRTLHHQLLHMHNDRRDEFDALCTLIGRDGLALISELRIEPFDFPSPKKDDPEHKERYYFFRWTPAFGNARSHAFGNLSFGTRRLLRLFVTMFYHKSSVMLIEQPEDGIHRGLLHQLVPTLESYCDVSQVVLATHASEILNKANTHEIRFVSMNDDGLTFVRRLTADEQRAAQVYMDEQGSLSDFLEMIEE